MISNNLLKEKIIDTIIQGIDSPIKRISEIASVVSKGTTPRGGNVCYTNNGVLFIRAENIGYGSNNLLNKKFVDIETHENYLKRSILKENDILVSIAGALGRTSFVEKEMLPCNCNQAVAFIRINENIDFIPQYICYCIMSRNVQTSLLSQVKKTAQPNLTLEHIKNIKIPFPTYEEQLEITKKIESLFELIDQKEKNDREKEKLKTLLKDKILDSAIHGTLIENDLSLSPVDVNEVDNVLFGLPSNWKWAKIANIGNVIGGGTPNTNETSFWDGSVNWITPADMKTDDKYIVGGKKSITKEGLEKSSARLMPKGTIVISSRAPIGYVKIAKEDVSTSQGCKSIVINEELVTSDFVYYYIKSIREYLNSIGTGVTFREVSGKTLSDVNIPVPPLEEQHRIVEKIEQCFELIEQL